MSNRLVAFDKCPGVRPVGIGEVWRRLMAKCVLSVAGHEAKTVCGSHQLCCGLEAGIEGAVHTLSEKWTECNEEDDWGVLLVDARNAFNEGNRIKMLWTVRHLWPAGARFAFNCYRHWSTLIFRGKDGNSTSIIQVKKGLLKVTLFLWCYMVCKYYLCQNYSINTKKNYFKYGMLTTQKLLVSLKILKTILINYVNWVPNMDTSPNPPSPS